MNKLMYNLVTWSYWSMTLNTKLHENSQLSGKEWNTKIKIMKTKSGLVKKEVLRKSTSNASGSFYWK